MDSGKVLTPFNSPNDDKPLVEAVKEGGSEAAETEA